MGYEIQGTKTMSHLLFGGSKTAPYQHKCYKVRLKSLDGTFACNYQAYHQETICQGVQAVPKGPWLSELLNRAITLTDTTSGSQKISLLIGADIVGKLYTGQLYNLECGATAMETRLGWTLIGKNNEKKQKRIDPVLLTVSMFARDASIEQLWRLDTIGIVDPIEQKSKETQQQEVLDRFRDTIQINCVGRYEVRLQWKEDHAALSNNRAVAEKRLGRTLQKLETDGLLADYEQVFLEWLSEGIIEEVPESELRKGAYYLPHRHVVKEGSTTCIRPVFDASARDIRGPSLNQCLEPGPNLIEQIPTLLLRFRENAIGVIADIRKAFLQISIVPEDRDVLRFLWKRSDSQEGIVEYRHCRVVFGVTSSPFLLGATIDLHLEEAITHARCEELRLVLERLKKSFYVDNCVTSVSSKSAAESFQKTAISVMNQAGFDLRDWEITEDTTESKVAPVLGLSWNKESDTLSLADTLLENEIPEEVTKRVILSITQRVFDPLGMASPTVLLPKVMLQRLWQTDLNWDTEVPVSVRKAFITWCQELPLLKELKIRRWAFGEREDQFSLHLFVDASMEAYGAVLYSRIESSDGVKVEFVEAKSRVAPKERSSIPRLELLAATVGARLLSTVMNTVSRRPSEIHCWSDSATVLAWIQRNLQWATFVFNRVQEIRRLTDITWWKHVPGELNPADLPSRGCSARQLIQSHWLQGPEWLRLPADLWPATTPVVDELYVNCELRKTPVKSQKTDKQHVVVNQGLGNATHGEADDIPWYLRRFSKYMSIVKLVGWILRFMHNTRRALDNRTRGELTAKEIELAEVALMTLSQQESFSSIKDPRLNSMVIIKDKHGTLRLKSLIENRDDAPAFRHPIILDSSHILVKKLIEYHHDKLLHGPIDTVINVLREKFWILQCRKAVRAMSRRCITCRRYNAKRMLPQPSSLPEDRVRDARVFEIVGIDLAGPLFLKSGDKAWVCLFTCAVYRAVHLELISSLSTESFLEALRRFISRRGRPSVVYTDNGTNFRGARNYLKRIHWDRVVKDGSIQEIEWRFNPPAAPWWGGWWERLVRLMKDLLRKSLKKSSLTFEELTTVLCDCEAVMNARPLTYLSEDSHQLIPLSPNLFLQEIRETGVPDLDAIGATSINKRHLYLQQLREQLRKRFRIEYLGQLQRGAGCSSISRDIKVGDLVFCGNDLLKRLDWPLAKVVELYPGKDGRVRVVKLKTATGELVRPLQRLYPLEVSSIEKPVLLEKFKQQEAAATAESFETSSSESQELVEEDGGAKEEHVESTSQRSDESEEKQERRITNRRGRLIKVPARYC